MKKLFLSLTATFLISHAIAQTSVSRAQARLICYISNVAEWPGNLNHEPFVIGIMGDTDLSLELDKTLENQTINGKPAIILNFNNPEEISACNVLFVPFSKSRLIPVINKYIEGMNTLMITERHGALEAGSSVNFLIDNDHIKFEVNAEHATAHGVYLNMASRGLASQ